MAGFLLKAKTLSLIHTAKGHCTPRQRQVQQYYVTCLVSHTHPSDCYNIQQNHVEGYLNPFCRGSHCPKVNNAWSQGVSHSTYAIGSEFCMAMTYLCIKFGLLQQSGIAEEGLYHDQVPQVMRVRCCCDIQVAELFDLDLSKTSLQAASKREILAAMLAAVRDSYWCKAAACHPEPALMMPITVQVAASGTVQPMDGFYINRALAAAEARAVLLPEAR